MNTGNIIVISWALGTAAIIICGLVLIGYLDKWADIKREKEDEKL